MRRSSRPAQWRARPATALLVAALLVALSVAAAFAMNGGDYLLDWFTVDSGGATRVEGGGYALGGTSGQPEADPTHASGGDYRLKGGFWYGRSTLAMIGGMAWLDANMNGVIDPEEAGFPNAMVQLVGAARSILDETSTAQDGTYVFTDLPPGPYQVRVVPPPQYTFSDPGVDSKVDPATGETGTITIAAGEQSMAWNAGIFAAPTEDPQAEEPAWWEDALRTFLPAINR